MSLTTDNASVNDVIVATVGRCILARYGIPYTPDMHIRCIAHVINLIVQAFLAALDEADNPDDIDYYEFMKDLPIHYNVDEDQDQIALDNESLDEASLPAAVGDDLEGDEVDIIGESAVKRVRYSSILCRHDLTFHIAPLYHYKNCFIPSTPSSVPKNCSVKVWQQ